MKKIIFLGFLGIFLFCIGNISAVECTPTLNVGNGCDITSSLTLTPGNYSYPGGINITGNNVVLNCNGANIFGDYSLNYTNESGYYVEGTGIRFLANNIVVKNCGIFNFSRAILLDGTRNGITIHNNVFMYNYAALGRTEGAKDLINISNNFVKENHYGFDLYNYPSITRIFFHDNIVTKTWWPIQLGYSTGGTNYVKIYRNKIVENTPGTTGIYSLESENVEIYNNNFSNNGQKGIELRQTQNLKIHDNIIDNNMHHAIQLWGDNLNVSHNEISGNGGGYDTWDSIFITQGNGIYIHDNNMTQNRNGPYVAFANNLNIYRNDISFSNGTGNGVYIWLSDIIRVYQNNFTDNLGTGVISEEGSNRVDIYQNKITNNGKGVYLSYVKDFDIYENKISGSEFEGIDIKGSHLATHSYIFNNNINDNLGGILYNWPLGARIYNNTINNNQVNGIYFTQEAGPLIDTDNYIYDNFIQNNIGSGFKSHVQISITPDPFLGIRNHIYNNEFDSNVFCGVDLGLNTYYNQVHDNNFINNFNGVCLQSSSRNNIRQNYIFQSANAGINFLSGTSENTIKENDITQGSYGIRFSGTETSEKIYINNIYNNDVYNVYKGPGPETIDVSYFHFGNYWGHTSAPCFRSTSDQDPDTPTDTITDSYPYCEYLDLISVDVEIPDWDWYMVGLPLYPENTEVESMLAPIEGYYSIVKFFANGIGADYTPDNPFPDLTNLYPWYGYWIKVDSLPPNDLVVVGNEVTGCNPLTLQAGTNPKHWIGYWLDNPQETGSALSSIDGNYEYARQYYDGAWRTYVPGMGEFNDLEELRPGFGYLIKMTNQDTLDYICG